MCIICGKNYDHCPHFAHQVHAYAKALFTHVEVQQSELTRLEARIAELRALVYDKECQIEELEYALACYEP